MPQIATTVTYSKKDISEIVLAHAKEVMGKPTGGLTIEFPHTPDLKTEEVMVRVEHAASK